MRTMKPYEETEVYLNIFLILLRDWVRGQFDHPAPLCPHGKIAIAIETWWGPELAWTCCRKDKSLTPLGTTTRILGSSLRRLKGLPNTSTSQISWPIGLALIDGPDAEISPHNPKIILNIILSFEHGKISITKGVADWLTLFNIHDSVQR